MPAKGARVEVDPVPTVDRDHRRLIATLPAPASGPLCMSDAVRLSRRVADLARCSRIDAERRIKGGWVRVDGVVVEDPARLVSGERVEIDPEAQAEAIEPATVLLHKPAGHDAISGPSPAAALVRPETHWAEDPSGVRLLQRHFQRLTPLVPLDAEASGLMVLTQDGRVWRRLTEDGDEIEQEFVVETRGEIAPYGLRKLEHGLRYQGRALPPCKVSWQNEVRLRFAIKGAQGAQLRDMCAQVGLDVVSIRRLRIGKVSLAKMPVGAWRYLPVGEKF
jgi:23S rRNA pseudouridine2604 synthase